MPRYCAILAVWTSFVEITIDHGSIVTTEAVCLTNKVDIGLYSKKVRPLKWLTSKL